VALSNEVVHESFHDSSCMQDDIYKTNAW